MLSTLTMVLLTAAPLLGSPIVQEGFSFRPPEAFRVDRQELFLGSEVLAISGGDPAIARRLTTVLRDGKEGSEAVLLVASVSSEFQATPAGRDSFVQQVVAHLAELDLEFSLERAELVRGANPRVEVLGTIKQEGGFRSLLISAIPGEMQHVVVTLSSPTSRLESLLPEVRESLSSFQIESPPSSLSSRRIFGAFAGTLAGALIASLAFWRRRRAARERVDV